MNKLKQILNLLRMKILKKKKTVLMTCQITKLKDQGSMMEASIQKLIHKMNYTVLLLEHALFLIRVFMEEGTLIDLG